MVVNNGGNYTKHIYMGSQRITSKVGNSGIFTSRNPMTDTTALNKSYTTKLTSLTTKIKERFDSLGVKYSGTAQTGGLVSSSPLSGDLGGYFYHSDHLGSSSLITDANGSLVQHIEYVPFGETFIDERNGNWSTPYLFNAKEQDEETGLHYFGARYYDSRLGVWLSVDPLAEKYPNIGSYVYCANNPVKYVDSDGKEWKYFYDCKGHLHINASINLKTNNLTVEQVNIYKKAINSEFSRMLEDASGGIIVGSITFDGSNNANQFTPTMVISGGESTVAGLETIGGGIVTIFDKNKKILSPEFLASNFIHELLHTLRLEHPHQQTQTLDAALIKISTDSYITMLGTNVDEMRFNIMSYPNIKINGISYYELNSIEPQSRITPEQIKLMLKEIDLQKKGYGLINVNFYNYWLKPTGYEVK